MMELKSETSKSLCNRLKSLGPRYQKLVCTNFAFLIALFIGTYLMPITYNDSYLMSYTNKQSNMPIYIIQGDMHLYAKTVSNVQASSI